MSDPTREELQAEIAMLKLLLGQRGATAAPHPNPVSSSERVTVSATPQQTTIASTHVEPTAEVFPPGKVPGRYAVPKNLLTRATARTATPEEIIEQIKGLKSVIVSGVDSAGYGDKRTDFRSLAELRQILSDLEEELDELTGTGGRIRQIRMTSQWDKGL